MKAFQFAVPLVLLCAIACGNNNGGQTIDKNPVAGTTVGAVVVKDTFEKGKIIPHVLCRMNAEQTYALYIPLRKEDEGLPVIYFFDPHGDGLLPLAKYKILADKYGFILAGSNNSRNGNDWQTAENIWTVLYNDTKDRLKINVNRLYTCGFSGGAKVAGYIALHHPEIKALIAGGAGLPDEISPADFPFGFTAIAGEGDMNMTELVAFSNALDETQTRHRLIFFDGKHEWAPESTMNTAFAGLQLDAMRDKLIAADKALITTFADDSKKRINGYLHAKDYVKAAAECRVAISMLEGVTPAIAWFHQKNDFIKNNPAYKQQVQAREHLLAVEQEMKSSFIPQFQQGDMNYWMTTVRELQAKSQIHTAEGAMYQRLLAYLSLAFYSISNRLIRQERNTEAQHFVELYKTVDATNSEAWYFSALLHARNKEAQPANSDLLKAAENGFTDIKRLRQQPEFQHIQIDFSAIENRMKK